MKKMSKSLAIALSTAMASSMVISSAQASDNPFGMKSLDSGYQVSMSSEPEKAKKKEGKCGGDMKKKEGKCGGDMKKKKEGKCGEGKCGGKK